ncbi:MAG: amino acid ABC transporter permease [Eubacteriales bacterium]|nr:amino acid ABC transporter permease [Eubacteriales bacterium]
MSYIQTIMPALMQGAVISLELFALTLIFSLPLGLPIALGENTKIAPVRWLCKVYVLVFRGTPLMLQLFFFYFFFPICLNIRMDAFPTAVLTFALNYAAYFAEIYRGGMKSIDVGQYEAAHSLGLSRTQTLFGIVLPQTFRVVIPPISNEIIVLVKDTALASAIALADIMKVSKSIVNRDGSLMAYVIAAAMYLVFSFLVTYLLTKLEKKASLYDGKES